MIVTGLVSTASFFNGTSFIEHPGGSLIHHRANTLSDLETVIESRTNVFTFRGSQSLFGDGFVEAIANSTLQQIAAAQPTPMRGEIINVPVLEKPGETRIGRFGWKGQQASLVSFSADVRGLEPDGSAPAADVPAVTLAIRCQASGLGAGQGSEDGGISPKEPVASTLRSS